jgi:hypothetical protein
MTEKEKKLRGYQNAEDEGKKKLEQAGLYYKKPSIWQVLIEHFQNYDVPTDVLFENLTGERIFDIVSQYYTRNGRPMEVIDVEVSEYVQVVSEGKIEKAQIRSNGCCWVIHRNDQDTFPSNPHAHDYDNNVKLDLGSGMIYRKKDPYKKMSKKELMTLRNLIRAKLPDLPLPEFTR